MYSILTSKSCRSHGTVLGQVVLPKAQDLKNVRVRNISGARLSYLRAHLTAGVGGGAVSCRCLSRMRSALATAHGRRSTGPSFCLSIRQHTLNLTSTNDLSSPLSSSLSQFLPCVYPSQRTLKDKSLRLRSPQQLFPSQSLFCVCFCVE